MLLLDASGSMSEAEGTGTRMDAAIAAAHALVDVVPATEKLGIVAFGTGTGSSAAEKVKGCQDVATLRALTPVSDGGIDEAIDALTPSGYTPLGASLEHSAAMLPQDGPAMIVLVTDGEDTCAPPVACEVAAQLHQQNPQLTISTLGFRTANDELSCIASKTGGIYVTADNADQLASRIVAARDLGGNANALTPTGLAGVELGSTMESIGQTHPEFADANRRDEGDRVIVRWRDCDWLFEQGKLTEITLTDSGKNIDGLAIGAPLSDAVALYGEPASKSGQESLFPASTEAGTSWKIGHDGDAIRTITLCRCLPDANSPSSSTAPSSSAKAGLTFGAWGPLKVGMTRAEFEAAGFTGGKKFVGMGCEHGAAQSPNNESVYVYFVGGDRNRDGQVLSVIQSSDGTAALPNPKPTVAQVRAAYPTANVTYIEAVDSSPARLIVEQTGVTEPIFYNSVVGTGDSASAQAPATGPAGYDSQSNPCPQP